MKREYENRRFIMRRITESVYKRYKWHILFLAIVWTIYFITCMIRANIGLGISDKESTIIEICARLSLCFGIGFLIGFFMCVIDTLDKLLKIYRFRYAYRIETCMDCYEEDGIYIMTTDTGKEYEIIRNIASGKPLFIIGIEGHGESMYILTTKEYERLTEEGKGRTKSFLKKKKMQEVSISATDFLIQQFKISYAVFVLPILIFVGGLLLLLSGLLVSDSLLCGLIRFCGGLTEVLGVLLYILLYLEKLRADEKVQLLKECAFTYRVEHCMEVYRKLVPNNRLMYRVSTNQKREYELVKEVHKGEDVLIVDFYNGITNVFPLTKGRTCFKIMETKDGKN